MFLVVDVVLPNWVSRSDALRSRRRLNKHLFVFLAVLVGISTSGLIRAVEVRRSTSGRESEQLRRTGNTTEISSISPSMDNFLIESLFRSGFYSATFDRICQKLTSRHLVTGSTGSRGTADLTSEDRSHSTDVNSFDRPASPGGARRNRLRRSTATKVRPLFDKRRQNEIIRSTDCNKINANDAISDDNDLIMAATRNRQEVNEVCSEDEEYNLGCYPKPQIVRLTDLCNELDTDIGNIDTRTIIHVCPDVACCQTDNRCQVTRYAKVDKTFMVEDSKTITISFRNHTECACARVGHKSVAKPATSRKLKIVTGAPANHKSRSTSKKNTV